MDGTGEARKYFGGSADDYQLVLNKAPRAAQGTALGKFTDPLATIKPLDEIERAAKMQM